MASAKPATTKTKKTTAKPLGEGSTLAVAAPPVAPKPAPVDDLFADLASSATKESDVKPTDKDRDIITLTGDDAAVMDRFCKSKVWFDKTKGINEAAKADLGPILMRNVVTKMLAAGSRIGNPRFITTTSKVMFQVKNTVNLKLPLAEEGKQVSIEGFFEQAGIPKIRATALAELFTRTTTLTMVPISDLNTSNKPLAEKIMRSIKGLPQEECREVAGALAYNPELAAKVNEMIAGLSANERKDALRVASEVTTVGTPEATISKMAAICKTPVELAAAMDAANVGTAVSQATYDGDLMEAGKALMEATPDSPTKFASPDKVYQFEAKGTTAVITRGNEHVLTKQCTDAGHAKATCQKWQRDPKYLASTLAEHFRK